MYYVVLVSRIQNSDSVICVCVCIYIYSFSDSFHYMLVSSSLFIYPAMLCYPLLLSPIEAISLFSMSGSLFLFCE